LTYLSPVDDLIAGDPTHIGPYRLIARLGAGGMGLVYLGRSEVGRTVTVKVVQAEHAGHPEFRRRFAREVAAARRVGGSWTAAVLDADPEAAVPWVATQYIPGPDLRTVVAEDFGPLPEHSVRTLANRLALALEAVHEAGLIHRDLKPSNVLVTVDGPRVIDFGIARAMDSLAGDSVHTRTGMLIGSPGFMSPEQVRGLELTPASDVFCLGAVLVYAATGRHLFGARDTGLNAHLFRVAEEEADLTGVPEPLVDLVRACLHKDPAQRPTPREVAARTATDDREGEWLPGSVLAQLGRHAAQLLDFAPPVAPVATAVDPRAAQPRPQPRPYAAPMPQPPPAYAPTATAYSGPVQGGFGPPPVGDGVPPHPRRWWGLAVIALAQLVLMLATASFTSAVPSVHRDLGLSSDALSLMYTLHLLAFGALLPLGGQLADLVGRRRTLIIGLVGCAAAAALGGSAGNAATLISARVLQGAAGALVASAALALVAAGFTGAKERGRAFGVFAAVAGGGSALGILLGGVLVDALTWRWALYAGIPLAVLALIGAVTLVHDTAGGPRARFDVVGVLLGTGGLAALTYGLGEAPNRGWAVPLVLVLLVVGAALLVAFVGWQLRRSSAGPEPSAVTARDRVGGFVALLLTAVGVLAVFAALAYALPGFYGYDLLRSGLAFLPMAAAAAIGATQVSARLLPRVAPRVLIVAGMAAAALGAALLAIAPGLGSSGRRGYLAEVLPGMALAGFGIGVAFVPLFVTMAAVAPRHSGAAAALALVGQHTGGETGSALLGTMVAASLSGASASGANGFGYELLSGHVSNLWWGAGSLLLAGLAAAVLVTARAPGAPGAAALPGPRRESA
jgi:MFS family permease